MKTINRTGLKSIIIVFIFAIICFSCNKNLKYQGDWIIMELEYRDTSIIEYSLGRNMIINFDQGGVTPPISYTGFQDKDMTYNESFTFYKKGGKKYIKMSGSKFFTDTFEVKECKESCCELVLKNEEKYIKLIFNGELSMFIERRDCPYFPVKPLTPPKDSKNI